MNILSIIRRVLAWVFGDAGDSAAGVTHHQEPEEREVQPHVGRWIEIDQEPVHILAEENLSDETYDTIAMLVRAARQYNAERYPNGMHLELGSDEPRDDTD